MKSIVLQNRFRVDMQRNGDAEITLENRVRYGGGVPGGTNRDVVAEKPLIRLSVADVKALVRFLSEQVEPSVSD